MYMDFEQINDDISKKLISGKPFSLIRIDNTCGYVIQCMYRNWQISGEFFNEQSLFQGGINPPTFEYMFNTIFPETIKAMSSCDILGFVDISKQIQNDPDFLSLFGNKPFFNEYMVLDPGALFGCSPYGHIENPWTKYLNGKKVLTISTHADSITHQSDKLDLIWGEHREKIAPFDFVGCIRAPYHKDMDDRQYPNAYTWDQTVEAIKREIDKYDYDVLLAGSTNQSPIFAEYAKQQGKVGIQTGGVLQLFFGLLGKRWDAGDNGYAPWSACFNKHWIRPFESDKPQKQNVFGYNVSESDYAYW